LFDGGDMNEKAPRGCVTCYVALNEIIKPERPMGYFPLQWETAFETPFGKAVDGLDDFDLLRMIRAANDLQGQLVGGTRIACYIGQNDLENFPSHAFSSEGSAKCLVKGRVLHYDLDKEIFIRECVTLHSRTTSNEAPPKEAVSKGGRPRLWQAIGEYLKSHYPDQCPDGLKITDWRKLVEEEMALKIGTDLRRIGALKI
jgi:hypothetical protein